MTALQNLVSDHIKMRLRSLPKTVTNEIYAISLYMDLHELDEPQLNFSFNTASQVAKAMAGKTQAYGNPGDVSEARWNYAFWLQTPNSCFLAPADAEMESYGKPCAGKIICSMKNQMTLISISMKMQSDR